MLTVPQALLAGLLLMSVLMTLLWLWQRAHTDAGIVDVGWASGLGVLAVLDAVVMPGDPARRVLVAALAGIWSFRLGWHLLTDRIVGKPEDGRYQTLREQWAPHAQRAFFFFFQAQALAAVLFSLPFVAAMHHARPLGAWDAAAACGWLIAFTGETSAEAQ